MADTSAEISAIDVAVLVVYFALVAYLGYRASRAIKTSDDLFLAGRALGWGAIGLSLFASNISSTTLIGLSGQAYATGLPVSAYEFVAGVPLILLAFVYAPLFLKARVTTVPEYLELRFDRRVRLYFSGATIGLTIIVDTAGGLYAGAVVLRTFFPGLDLWATCAAIGIFAGVYTAAGGLRAVVYTDMLQAIVLLLGGALLTVVLFEKLDWSWSRVVASAPADHFSLVRPLDDETLPWTGLMIGVPLLGFWYWVTNQYIVQRVLGAKDLKNAQYGALLAGGLKLLPLFVMVLPGAMAISLYPGLPNPDMVFPTLVAEALPVGATGLVLAGLIAAIMSSVDSTLNASSTLIVHDFVSQPGHALDAETAGRYGRIATIALTVLAVGWAPLIAEFGGLWSYLQQVFSILVPPVIAVFLLGAFWRRATADAAFLALLSGHLVGAGLFLLTQYGHWTLHFTENVGVMALFSMAVMILVSCFQPEPAAGEDMVWRPEIALDGAAGRGLAEPRVLAVFVLLGVVGTVIAFW